jgi:hypothetical protein
MCDVDVTTLTDLDLATTIEHAAHALEDVVAMLRARHELLAEWQREQWRSIPAEGFDI